MAPDLLVAFNLFFVFRPVAFRKVFLVKVPCLVSGSVFSIGPGLLKYAQNQPIYTEQKAHVAEKKVTRWLEYYFPIGVPAYFQGPC